MQELNWKETKVGELALLNREIIVDGDKEVVRVV